jgi:hypothetical protein
VFRAQHRIDDALVPIDESAVYWKKTAEASRGAGRSTIRR